MPGRRYDDTTRAAALAALLSGEATRAVAKQFDVPWSTVRRWRAELMHRDLPALPAHIRASIGGMLAALLIEMLRTMALQQQVLRDGGWLSRQDAAGMAVLHGVLTDKALRLIMAAAIEEPQKTSDFPPGNHSGEPYKT